MIPNSKTFNKKYRVVSRLTIILISGILTSSLIRNVIDISLMEIIVGLGAIGLSITWSSTRDGLGYFTYSVSTMRFFDNQQEYEKLKKRGEARRFPIIYSHPFYNSLLTLVGVIICSVVIWLCGPALRYWLIAFAGLIIIPVMILHQLTIAAEQNIISAIERLIAQKKKPVRVRYFLSYLTEDLLLSLAVNFALVLPIARKPAFSLAEGYENPAFIVAFMILLTIVMLFMLCFAIRQRRYVLFGELLGGYINEGFMSSRPCAFMRKSNTLGRLILWLFLTAIWSVVICLLFSQIQKEPDFGSLYFCSLLPIIGVYCLERHNLFYTNFKEALEMEKQYIELRDNFAFIDK
ncbi:hypothetical protein ABN228_19590 [Providencia rettgeri]|uniref:hypothetical protein n=1 Tax=Providencia rettgeri TaxID=587 RepID=UPI0032DA31B1